MAVFMMLINPSVFAVELGIDYSLVSPREPFEAGAQGRVELVAINRLTHETRPLLSATVKGTIIDGSNSWPVELIVDRDSTVALIPTGGFALIPLTFEVPTGLSGTVELAMDAPVPLRAILEIEEPLNIHGITAGPMEEKSVPSSSDESVRPLAIEQLSRYYPANVGIYEPVYLLYGSEAPGAKFQFSFKYRLFEEDGWLSRQIPFTKDLILAYTQRTLWDVGAESKPFYDTSYMPEFGYIFFAPEPDQKKLFTWLGGQIAVGHKSNGKSGPESRSLDTLFVRPSFAIGDIDGWHLIIAPKLFTYLDISTDNHDIANYRGYGNMHLVFAQKGGPALSVDGWIGQGFNHGTAQFDLTFPTSLFSGSLASFVHIQYWTGYGESLLDYDKRTDVIRFGFSLVR